MDGRAPALTSGVGLTSARTRARMVERVRALGVVDELVLEAMQAVPRHLFVDEALASRAYDDAALPLGHGQTISQPYIVGRTLELARNRRALGRVLEIGTGCGYQAALLERISDQVYSVERLAVLLEMAKRNLRRAGALRARLVHGDGNLGIPEAAPFDAIVIAAAAPAVPRELLQQLASGGRMVLPVGEGQQDLMVVERTASGFRESRLEPVRFVPLLRGTA